MAPRNHPLAIASLVTGILAIVPGCCCGLLGLPLSIAAIITGIIGITKINAAPDQVTGKGMAIAGLVCGGVAIALDVASLFLNVAGQIMQSAGGGGP
jgi:hypothetical protein